MSSSIQSKTHGVLHAESYFSFFGFLKKIGSSKTQEINVYIAYFYLLFKTFSTKI